MTGNKVLRGWQAAAAAAGCSIAAMRRLLARGAIHAQKAPDGVWEFPLTEVAKAAAMNGKSIAAGVATAEVPSPLATKSPPPASPVTPLGPWLQGVPARAAVGESDDEEVDEDDSEDDATEDRGLTPLSSSSWSSWLMTRDDQRTPIVDPATMRISYVQPAALPSAPVAATAAPVRPDQNVYWAQRHQRATTIANANAQAASVSGFPREVVHAVFCACGNAAWALDDRVLWTDQAFWSARLAGEATAAQWMWHMAAAHEQASRGGAERGYTDLERARERRLRRRHRR